MNKFAKKKLFKHYNKYFGDKPTVMSTATNHDDIEIVVLLYAPNDKYPFWKIATIGCSEIEHKLKNKTVYNEYVIFVNKEENLETNISLRNWYYDMLLVPDGFARDTKKPVVYGCDIVFEDDESKEEMVGICLLFPQIITEPKFFVFNQNPLKQITIFQVMPITHFEKEIIASDGIKVCEKLFYPENDSKSRPFAQQKRTFDKF